MKPRVFSSITVNRMLVTAIAALAILVGAAGCQNKPLLLRNRPNVPPPLLDPDDSTEIAAMPDDFTQPPPTLAPETNFVVPQAPQSPTANAIQPPVIKAEPLTYTVLPHDTFWKIARMYGVTQQELASCNNMSLKKPLKVGVVLLIPPGGSLHPERKISKPTTHPHVSRKPSRKPASKPVAEHLAGPGGTYVVKPHDNLWKIANRHHVSLKALEQANNIDPTKPIRPGMKLIIPGHGAATTTSAPSVSSHLTPPDEISVDIPATNSGKNAMRPENDDTTLLKDAAKAASGQPEGQENLDDVFDADSDSIDLGKAAKIAEEAAHPAKYTHMPVLPDDTLQSISDRYNVPPETIKKLNPDAFQRDGRLKPFATIRIPTQ